MTKPLYDDRGFMKPWGENGLLFTTENLVLEMKDGNQDKIDYSTLMTCKAITNVFDGFDITYGDENGNWSHDNHTALLCASYILDLQIEDKFLYKGWYRRIHPRDLGYYLYLFYTSKLPKLGVISTLLRVLLIPTAIAMMVSCYQQTKVRNGVTFNKTDGKLLAWLRFNTVRMPLVERICTYLIERNPIFGSWKNVFTIYFGADHPNSNFDEEVYND